MKTSEVFKRAKNNLYTGHGSKGKTEYICSAIALTRCSVGDKERTTDIIMNLLDGCVTFGIWLKFKKGIENDRIGAKVQETRHAWLDHLITHYSNIGD